MSDTVKGKLTHYQNATNGDSVIEAEIIGVGAVGLFANGWIGYGFLYESPRVILDLDTEIGEFQLDLAVSELDYEPILSLSDDGEVKLQRLLDKRFYIASNENFDRACISNDSNVSFNRDRSHIIRCGDDRIQNVPELKMDTEIKMSGTQKMPLTRMNHILQTEIQRRFDGECGWMRTEIEMVETNDEVIFTSDIDDGVSTASWSFNSNVNGYESIEGFMKELNLECVLTERSGKLWVKPVRDIHFDNRPTNTDLISDNQTWIASSQPMKPEEDTPSIIERIKGFFSTTEDIEISANHARSKKSQIATTYSEHEQPCYCSLSESIDRELGGMDTDQH